MARHNKFHISIKSTRYLVFYVFQMSYSFFDKFQSFLEDSGDFVLSSEDKGPLIITLEKTLIKYPQSPKQMPQNLWFLPMLSPKQCLN